MSSALPSLVQNLAPFLDATDPVVSTVLSAIAQALNSAQQNYQQVLDVASVLSASGSDLDRWSQYLGIYRLAGESDSQLLARMAAVLDRRTTPDDLAYQLGLLGIQAQIYEPGGGSLVGWKASWAFSYDRQPVSLTYTRNSSATGPDGTEEPANVPTWLATSGGTYWAGVWQGTTQLLTNTNFGTLTSSNLPQGYTITLQTNDTASVVNDSSFPIDPVLEIVRQQSNQSAAADTVESPAASVSASTTYTLSVYINTSQVSGGSVTLSVYDASAGTTKTLAQQGATSGYVRLWGTYTTGTTASTIQLIVAFPSGTYGTLKTGAWQIEPGPVPTEYLRNSATSGTVSRAAATLTAPSSVVPVWGQGTVALAVQVEPATNSSAQSGYLLQTTGLAVEWTGSAWTATLSNSSGTTSLSASGPLSLGSHYLAVRWNTLLGEADLWIDGTKVASASGTIYAPTSASTLYIGSSSAGSAQINAYVGNVTVLDAWVSDSTVSSWSSTDRTPIYGSTLLQGNFENKSLSASTGGTEFGTAYGLRIQLAGSSAPLADAFVLDVSGMDSGYALQPSSSSSIPQQYAPAPPLAQNVAGGVDVQPWNPGSLQ